MAGRSRRASVRRSRQMRQSTIGTHTQPQASQPRKRNSISFSSRNPAASGRTGQISQVMPTTTSRETNSAYSRRSRQAGFMVKDRKRSRVRTLLLALAILAVLLAAAFMVARFVFASQMSAKMHLDDPALAEVLVVPEEEDEPFYVLVAGTYADPTVGVGEDGPHFLMLTRVDTQTSTVTCVAIPHNIEMVMSDDNYHTLSYAQMLGGNAELVTQVENLMGVEVAHFVQLDAEGLVGFIDALGGVEVDLDQEVDDPDTGSLYLPAGVQTLDGAQVLTLVRADNYTTPLETRAKMQALLVQAITYKTLNASALGRLSSIDDLAQAIQTDMTFNDFWSLSEAFRDNAGLTFYSGMVPGIVTVDPDGTFFSVARAPLDNMMAAVNEGRNPDEAATISGLTPEIVRVTVRNGAGINGGASQVAQILEDVGYQVPETGNADNYVYDETLVVYKSDLMKPTAEDILAIMGNGRTIEAGLFYEFDTDIMVIIGKDWVPVN